MMLETLVVLDPPIAAKEFGDWQKTSPDPNIALKDKHGFVHISIEAETPESLNWFLSLVQEWRIA